MTMNKEYLLIADSGSTKTDWALILDGKTVLTCKTQGINPFMLSDEQLALILEDELAPRLLGHRPKAVRFYGAGCRDAQSERVKQHLEQILAGTSASVYSDLLGAARALCGNSPGIACILGTGSNSCLFNGQEIEENVSPLGFILGDEGSGAVLGKRLLGDVLKKQLPGELCRAFDEKYDLSPATIIEHVYRKTFPNRFLARFTHFLKENEQHPAIRALLFDEFTRFVKRNVLAYNRPDLPVSFVGSIAWHFSGILQKVLDKYSMKSGIIIKSPFDRLENL